MAKGVVQSAVGRLMFHTFFLFLLPLIAFDHLPIFPVQLYRAVE